MRLALKPLFTLGVLAAALSAAGLASAQSAAALDRSPAQISRAPAGQALSAASRAPAGDIVAGYLRSRGRSEAVLASLRSESQGAGRNGLTHLRLKQEVDGLEVQGAYLKATLNARGELVHVIDKLAPVTMAPAASHIDAAAALQAALQRVHPAQAAAGARALGTQGATTRFDAGSFFAEPPTATAVVLPLAGGALARGWRVETWTAKSNQLHHTLVDGDGRVLSVESRTANDSYAIFPIDPGKGGQQLFAGPGAGNSFSPAGWLGSGSQLNIAISGNNVDAYLDADGNNRADRGGTPVTDGNFVTSANLGVAPTTSENKAVAVQNLFYLNNVIHDVLYGYGFNEAAGNFQVDNFGKGGNGRDPVQAEAQDGSGTDNANFATPPDGRKPRMQMYLWTGAGVTHQVRVNSPVAAAYTAAAADFGASVTTAGTTGDVLVTVPVDGCTAISTALSGKVALIDRGACDFSTKALNAQSAGAIAVIIANNQGGTTVQPMGAGSGAKRVRIPALMISQNDGAALKSLNSPNATLKKVDPQPLQIDASLDSDIVYHEYCHGLTWRMIGGMSGPLAGAIGEGMADGCALLINRDDVVGEYSFSNPDGIRRHRYTNYPLTYKDVAGSEVHDDGEPYAAIVWRMMELFSSAYGSNPGIDRLFGYVVGGMNFTPATPAYEDMRDGILSAVQASGNVSDCNLVWQAFAAFDVGVGAKGVVNADGTVTVTPSSMVPASGTCH